MIDKPEGILEWDAVTKTGAALWSADWTERRNCRTPERVRG